MSELQLCEGKSIKRQSIELTQKAELSRRPQWKAWAQRVTPSYNNTKKQRERDGERERERREGKGKEEKRRENFKEEEQVNSLFHEAGKMEQSLKAAVPQFMSPMWSKIPQINLEFAGSQGQMKKCL